LLMRAPKGAWITSCLKPLASKKTLGDHVVCVGTADEDAAEIDIDVF